MGNVTSNLIESALQSSSASSVIDASKLAAVGIDVLANGQADHRLYDELQQKLAEDPTKRELYRLLQEMEKKTSFAGSDAAGGSESGQARKSESAEPNAESGSGKELESPTTTKPQASSISCPKKKFLKEYRFDEGENNATSALEMKPVPTDVKQHPTSEHAGCELTSKVTSLGSQTPGDDGQSSIRNRSNTISLPMRTRVPPPSQAGKSMTNKPGAGVDQQTSEQPAVPASGKQMPADMPSCTDSAARSQFIAESKHRDLGQRSSLNATADQLSRADAKMQYVIDRNHGPASSVAAYSSARQQQLMQQRPRREDLPSNAASRISSSNVTLDRPVSSHGQRVASITGEMEIGSTRNSSSGRPSSGYSAQHGYYYATQQTSLSGRIKYPNNLPSQAQPSKVLPAGAGRDPLRQHSSMAAATGSYQQQAAPGPGASSWHQVPDPLGVRSVPLARTGQPAAWSSQQHQLQSSEVYKRVADLPKDIEMATPSPKYQKLEAQMQTPVGYQQYASDRASSRNPIGYDQRISGTGYATVEARSKYGPVDAVKAVSSTIEDTFNTARRQAYEQIATMCSQPIPKQLVQKSSAGVGGSRMLSDVETQNMAARPLEPIEPSVRPRIAGLTHSTVPLGYDIIVPPDSQMSSRSSASTHHNRDDRDYVQYTQRHAQSGSSHQLQQLPSPGMMPSPVSSHSRHHSTSDSGDPVIVTSYRQHQTADTPLDLTVHKEEAMTAEAFLRRVQDPERYSASSRQQDYSRAQATYGRLVDPVEMEALARREVRSQQQQQYGQATGTGSGSMSGISLHHQPLIQCRESPRVRHESVPDWVSSRAPMSVPVDQKMVGSHALQPALPSAQVGRRADSSQVAYIGEAPVESRMRGVSDVEGNLPPPVLIPDESRVVWERRMQSMESNKMRNWHDDGSRQISSDARMMSMSSSGSRPTRYEQRQTTVIHSIPTGQRMLTPVSISGPPPPHISSSAYEQRPASTAIRTPHHSMLSPRQVVPSQLSPSWPSAATSSSPWMQKDLSAGRSGQVYITGMSPSGNESADYRRYETDAGRMLEVSPTGDPYHTSLSSPSLPQLSPIPSASGMSASAANRRIPIVQLLGSHSPSDILHLRCNVCYLTYGSLRSFRMHFTKAHGLEPGPEHFTIQTISEARHARGGSTQMVPVDCGDDSSLPPPALQREIANENINEARVAVSQSDALLDQQHRREFLLPIKQVAEVYPIPKKASPVVSAQLSDTTTLPSKPSPVPAVIKKKSECDVERERHCQKCHHHLGDETGIYYQQKAEGSLDKDKLEYYDSSDAGCPICLEGFSDVADYQSHIIKSHISSESMMRSCACKSCDLGFTNAGALRRHLTSVHKVMTTSASGAAIEVEYRCLFCPDAFADEHSLYRHTQAHEHHYSTQSHCRSGSMRHRYSYVHEVPPPSDRVQTAIPDTTCPEDQKSFNEATGPSAATAKACSDDGGSSASGKSPQQADTEDSNSFQKTSKESDIMSYRRQPGGASNSPLKTTSDWTPKTGSLKASILRRLSASRDGALTRPEPRNPTGVARKPAVQASPSSDKSGRQSPANTVFGDLVSLMHREVENSLRGFCSDTPPLATLATGPAVSVESSSPISNAGSASSKSSKCVRDVCDEIIAKSFQDPDEAICAMNSSPSSDQMEKSPASMSRPQSKPSADGHSSSRLSLNSSDTALSAHGGTRSAKELDSRSREERKTTERKKSLQQTARSIDLEASSLPENEGIRSDSVTSGGSEIDSCEDQPPLCIDLNQPTSDEEDYTVPSDGSGSSVNEADKKDKNEEEASKPVQVTTSASLRSSSDRQSSDEKRYEKPWRKRIRAELSADNTEQSVSESKQSRLTDRT